MNQILVILSVFLSLTVAHAERPSLAETAATANDTYYAILAGEFNAAKDAIAYSDFDEVGDPEAKTCLEVAVAEPYAVKPVNLFVFTRTMSGNGPSLPVVEIKKVIFGNYGVNAFRRDFDFVDMTARPKELIAKHQYSTERNWTLSLRRRNGLIYFKRSGKEAATTVDAYGYCFLQPTSKVK